MKKEKNAVLALSKGTLWDDEILQEIDIRAE
jgi:hypothetical protein